MAQPVAKPRVQKVFDPITGMNTQINYRGVDGPGLSDLSAFATNTAANRMIQFSNSRS